MATSRQKNIFGVLLAAGTGSRFGGGKLSADLNGQSLLQHAVGPLSAVFRQRLLLVLGYDWQALARSPCVRSGFFVVNDDYADGMGSSLALAVRAIRHAADAIVVALADQPNISADHLRRLTGAWSGAADEIVATRAAGVDCPPVLFPSACFDELSALRGDFGGRQLLSDARFRQTRLAFDAAAVDVDTPSDLSRQN